MRFQKIYNTKAKEKKGEKWDKLFVELWIVATVNDGESLRKEKQGSRILGPSIISGASVFISSFLFTSFFFQLKFRVIVRVSPNLETKGLN